MAKEAGKNVLLYVSDGTGSPTAFVAVAGQQSTEMNIASESDDITDKAHSGWGSVLTVLNKMTITAQGKADWPDTTGLEVIRAAWHSLTNIEAKIVLASTGAHYRGFFRVTAFNISGTHLNATPYSITLENNGVPTYSAS